MAFGDLRGTLSAGATSVTANDIRATGSVSGVAVGDLIVFLSAVVSSTANPFDHFSTDNLGNTYNTIQDTNDGSLRYISKYAISTSSGTITVVTEAGYSGSSGDDYASVAAIFEGPFDSLDKNITPLVDRTSPFTSDNTGTLTQANELSVSFLATTRGQTDTAAASPDTLAINKASGADDTAGSVNSAIGYRVVSSTSSISSAFTNSGSIFNGLVGIATFKKFAATSSGTVDATLDALTSSAAGDVDVSGSLSSTLAALTVAASSTDPISGSLTRTLANASLAAAGGVPINAVLAKTLANVTVFSAGVEFENLAVWPFMPDWQNDVTETLSWLTGLLSSRTGAEQRFGLRLTPRRSFEATFKPIGRFRTLFDLFTMRVGGSPFYIPVWHDSNKLSVAATAGGYSIDIGSTEFTEFQDSPGLFIGGTSRYEIAEYNGQTDTQILLATALVNSWPKGTRVFPIQKVQFDSQPQAAGKADRAYETRVKFRSIGGHGCLFETDIPLLLGNYVLEVEPNYVQDLSYNYDRIIAELDNQTGFSVRKDINTYGRVIQQYAFYLKGRERHAWFRAFMYALRGRQVPIYVPTFMSDIELTEAASGSTIIVKRCGYTEFSGPFPGRDRILVLLHDGTRYYRRIVSSAIIDDSTESLSISPPLFLAKNLVHRISFVPFSRLDQDDIEIVHHTDSSGLSTVTTVFKGIPDTLTSAATREAVVDIVLGLTVEATGTAEATKFYVEFTYIGYDNNDTFPGSKLSGACFGISTSSFDLDGATNNIYMASPATSNEQGSLFVFGQASGTGSRGYPAAITLGAGVGASGRTFGMMIDVQNKLIWVRDTSAPSTWYGASSGSGAPDPETGNRGFDYSGNLTTDPVFLIGGAYKDQSATGDPYAEVLLNTGFTSFAATPPSNSVAWDSTGATTWNPSDNGGSVTLSDSNMRVTGNNTDPTYNWHPFFCRSNTSRG